MNGVKPAAAECSVAVIILNYRSPGLVMDCLRTIASERESVPGLQVVVVDNASQDGSADTLAHALSDDRWQAWVRLVVSPVNRGFSAGNNVGIKAIDAHAYLLLNSDTLVRPGALQSLFNALESRPDAGIIGPRLEWPDGRAQDSAFRYRSPWTELIAGAETGPITRLLRRRDLSLGTPDQPIEAQWVSFAAALIRHEVIEQIGLMDEGYFMYFEDIDYCRQARQAGWTVVHWPEARVVHLRGGSSDVKKQTETRGRRPRYYYAARSRYFRKFYGGIGLVFSNLLWHAGRSIALVRELCRNKSPHACKAEWRDIWTNVLRSTAKAQDTKQ